MTWSKYGSEFWDDCANAGLSDAAVRTHGEAIGWIYRIEQTELTIQKHLIPRFAGSRQWETAVADLVTAGFWEDRDDTYVLVHHADVIRASIAAQQIKRDRDKRAQRSYRKRASDQDVSADVSACVIADADSQTDSLEGVRGDLEGKQVRAQRNGEVGPPSQGQSVSAYVSADALKCDRCGSPGPTEIDVHGWRVCVGRCAHDE